MFIPMWGVVVGGLFAAVGVVTTLCLLPKLLGAVVEGILD